ncbi:MAG: linear amide C-N hydrolase [Actinomycetes bacterium]
MRFPGKVSLFLAAVLALMLVTPAAANACTRILWNDNGVAVLTSRSADWGSPTQPVLVALPRGMTRDGGEFAGKQQIPVNPAKWTSRYGSVSVSNFRSAVFDGMNERGLSAHGLWLYASDYGPRDPSRQGIRTTLWTQYLLDNASTVSEAIELQSTIQPVLVPITTPDGSAVPIPVSIAVEDASGDSAIMQYIGGQLVVHHDRAFRVLANDPSFTDSQAALSKYDFTNATRDVPLPGNSNSMDRFIRANFYIDFLRKTSPKSRTGAVASLLSVARNVSPPIGAPYAVPGATTSTDWRTVSDATNRVFYFESTRGLSVLRTDLKALDLRAKAPLRTLDPLEPGLHGNVTGDYRPAKSAPFYGM